MYDSPASLSRLDALTAMHILQLNKRELESLRTAMRIMVSMGVEYGHALQTCMEALHSKRSHSR